MAVIINFAEAAAGIRQKKTGTIPYIDSGYHRGYPKCPDPKATFTAVGPLGTATKSEERYWRRKTGNASTHDPLLQRIIDFS